MDGMGLIKKEKLENKISYMHIQGGGVPGGHNVIYEKDKKPFITPMRECRSIELFHSDVVVDIGAYCGTYALRCARFPVRKVVAYEPTPRTFEILSLSKLPNMDLIQAAIVGDNRKSVELFISGGIGVTNSITLSKKKLRSITVPAVKYENAVAGATVVKIDVEGGEYSYPIIQPFLRAVIIDFHPVPGTDWIGKAKAIIAELENNGFQVVIKPDFSCGWTCAGSWKKPGIEETGEYFEPMMSGRMCCGCGNKIYSSGKSLCQKCWPIWLPRHREGYKLAKESTT